MKTALAIFLGTFALYLHTAGPALVPFRDAGEMTATVHTLGVLHPPSYPVYTLAGHLFDQIPLGNPSYRLNVFSGLMLSLTWVILYLTLSATLGPLPAFGSVLLGSVSYQFWVHALVSEMYTLNLLFLALVTWALLKHRWALAAACLGVGLANRLDLVLCFPAFFFLLYPAYESGSITKREVLSAGVTGFGGLLFYLYLPFRALQKPLFNWNNPSTLDDFWGSLTRRGYGGGLDLLSQSYHAGENFVSQLSLYGHHLIVDFVGIGVLAALPGLVYLWRNQRAMFYMTVTGFTVTGPLFIYLGNLPPNPHAVAIMESGYLMPDFFFLIAVAAGFCFVLQKPWTLGLVALAASAQAALTYPTVIHRENYVAVDFARNVRRTLPPQSIVISRSDVPLFSLFTGRWVSPGRADWEPLAQALVTRPWYAEQVRRQAEDLWLGPLRTPEEWETFARLNVTRPVFGTMDAEWPLVTGAHARGRGFLLGWNAEPSSLPLMQEFYVYRGKYRYDAYRDFFTPELIEEYAKGWYQTGLQAEIEKNFPAAQAAYRQALRLKPSYPYAALQLGYIEASHERWADADYWYSWAVASLADMESEMDAWKTLPETRQGITHDYAQVLVHRGVAQERLGHPSQAEALYNQALARDPENVDGLYNRAVLFWGKDWGRVVSDLQTLARVAPQDSRWKTYLPVAILKKNAQ